jgi:hypothetical protein
VIVLVVALFIVGVASVIAFGGLTALLRDESDDGRERLFGDTVTGTVVLAAGAVVVGIAVLALFVVGVAGLRS